MSEKLYKIIARVLDIPLDTINDSISPLNTPSWDSFNSIMLISELESAAGVLFDISDLMSVKNVGDIKKVLDNYSVKYEV